MKSLYIHIPFCNRICTYCDFNKFLIKNQPVDEYLDALMKELEMIENRALNTIFIGGGTPTALSDVQLERLLSFINKHFSVQSEFTVEANPDELTEEKIILMKRFGVDRLSLGVQTFNGDLLKRLGRTHHAEDVKRAVAHARNHGIASISIDLMYHLPGQTLADVKNDVEQALSLDIDHISSYSLILEPKTQFYNQYKKGLLQMPDDALAAEMYAYINARLAQTDFEQYEISNYAKKGHQSVHNKVYWQNKEYYGAGAGSHGYIDGVRYYNVIPVPHYIKAAKTSFVLESHEVTHNEAMEEFMFLGLRMNEGISISEFESRYHHHINEIYGPVIQDLIQSGLIIVDNDVIKMTDKGRMIGNDVFEKFLL